MIQAFFYNHPYIAGITFLAVLSCLLVVFAVVVYLYCEELPLWKKRRERRKRENRESNESNESNAVETIKLPSFIHQKYARLVCEFNDEFFGEAARWVIENWEDEDEEKMKKRSTNE